jgi:hypothetical protein
MIRRWKIGGLVRLDERHRTLSDMDTLRIIPIPFPSAAVFKSTGRSDCVTSLRFWGFLALFKSCLKSISRLV